MALASLATSVPAIPMATPISACFSAGASLTPSPVIATNSPRSWSAVTIFNFCSGATRAYTRIWSTRVLNSSAESRPSSSPVSTLSP
jgi:hypothetical protein